jgi:hypothetical protein
MPKTKLHTATARSPVRLSAACLPAVSLSAPRHPTATARSYHITIDRPALDAAGALLAMAALLWRGLLWLRNPSKQSSACVNFRAFQRDSLRVMVGCVL